MRYFFLVMAIWLASSTALAVNFTNIALLSKGKISTQFEKTVSDKAFEGKEEVLVGNDNYGYWLLAHDGSASATILPPGYKHPITFKVRDTKGEWTSVKSVQFSQPDLALFQKYFHLETNDQVLPVPFIAISVALPSVDDGVTKRKQAHATAIMNRRGEFVWLHVPDNGKNLTPQGTSVQVLSPKKLAVLAESEASHLEVVTSSGQILRSVSGKMSPVPFVMGPDFHLTEDLKQLAFLGTKRAYIRNPSKLWRKPKAYLGSTVAQYNWKNQIAEEIHNSFHQFNPVTNIAAVSDEAHFYRWDQKPVFNRASKYMSMMQVPEGYLITESQSNSVGMISLDGKAFLWQLPLGKKVRPAYLPNLGKHVTVRCARFDSAGQLIIAAASKSKTHIFSIDRNTETLNWHLPVSNPHKRKATGCAEPVPGKADTVIALSNEDRRGMGRIISIVDGKVATNWTVDGIGKSSRVTPLHSFGLGTPQ